MKDYFLHGLYFSLYGIVKYIPSPVGDFFRYWITKPFCKKIGQVRISEGVSIGYSYRVEIGSNVTLNNGVMIDGYGGLEIGNNVRIAHRVTILSSDHVFNTREIPIYKQGLSSKKTIIGDDCWLGCNCVILPGVEIGKGAIVGANAVVTKNVEPYSICGGIPAVLIKTRP